MISLVFVYLQEYVQDRVHYDTVLEKKNILWFIYYLILRKLTTLYICCHELKIHIL